MNFGGTAVVGFRAQVKELETGYPAGTQSGACGIDQKSPSPSVILCLCCAQAEHLVYLPPTPTYPRHLGSLYLASCKVSTATFTA